MSMYTRFISLFWFAGDVFVCFFLPKLSIVIVYSITLYILSCQVHYLAVQRFFAVFHSLIRLRSILLLCDKSSRI